MAEFCQVGKDLITQLIWRISENSHLTLSELELVCYFTAQGTMEHYTTSRTALLSCTKSLRYSPSL
eukprot:5863417-Ditylum_brightwellii.AAC.1